MISEWEKGDDVSVSLSKNASWVVIRDGTQIASENSGIARFNIAEYGTYVITADGNEVLRKSIENTSWFSNYQFKWWHILLVIAIGALIYFIFIRQEEETGKQMTFNLGGQEE